MNIEGRIRRLEQQKGTGPQSCPHPADRLSIFILPGDRTTASCGHCGAYDYAEKLNIPQHLYQQAGDLTGTANQ